MHATRAAVEEGIVPGGVVALVRAAKALDKFKIFEPGPGARAAEWGCNKAGESAKPAGSYAEREEGKR